MCCNFKSRFGGGDDSTDNLNRVHTFAFLAFLAASVGVLQYSGRAIDCWCPGHFTSSHVSYANAICWTNGTYFVAFEKDVPKESPGNVLIYYQWVPMLLFIRAMCLLLPSLFWTWASKSRGFDVANIVENFKRCHSVDIGTDKGSSLFNDTSCKFPLQIADTTYIVAGYLGRFYDKAPLDSVGNEECSDFERKKNKRVISKCTSFLARKEISYYFYLFCISPSKDLVALLYVTSKVLYTLISAAQFITLDSFLGGLFFNIHNLKRLFENLSFSNIHISHIFSSLKLDQSYFPKVTICDFHIRQQVGRLSKIV